jgi:hypothetical protein
MQYQTRRNLNCTRPAKNRPTTSANGRRRKAYKNGSRPRPLLTKPSYGEEPQVPAGTWHSQRDALSGQGNVVTPVVARRETKEDGYKIEGWWD